MPIYDKDGVLLNTLFRKVEVPTDFENVQLSEEERIALLKQGEYYYQNPFAEHSQVPQYQNTEVPESLQAKIYDRYFSIIFGRENCVTSEGENGKHIPSWFDKEGNLQNDDHLRKEFDYINAMYTQRIIEVAEKETLDTLAVLRSFIDELVAEGLGALRISDLKYLPFGYEYKNFALTFVRRIFGDDNDCNFNFLISIIDANFFPNIYCYCGRTMENKEVELAIGNIRNLTNPVNGVKAITDLFSAKEVNELNTISHTQKTRINYFGLTLQRQYNKELSYAEILDLLQEIASNEIKHNPNLKPLKEILGSKTDSVKIMLYRQVNALMERGFGLISLGQMVYFSGVTETASLFNMLISGSHKIHEIYDVLITFPCILNLRFRELAAQTPLSDILEGTQIKATNTLKKHRYVEDVLELLKSMGDAFSKTTIIPEETPVTHESIISIFGTYHCLEGVLYMYYAFSEEVECENYDLFMSSLLVIHDRHYRVI